MRVFEKYNPRFSTDNVIYVNDSDLINHDYEMYIQSVEPDNVKSGAGGGVRGGCGRPPGSWVLSRTSAPRERDWRRVEASEDVCEGHAQRRKGGRRGVSE